MSEVSNGPNVSYEPPLEEIKFILEDVLNAYEEAAELYPNLNKEESDAMLNMAAEFSKGLWQVNASGDQEGAHHNEKTKQVTLPKGFEEAYRPIADSGFVGFGGSAKYGGWEQPNFLQMAMNEMMMSANFSIQSIIGLSMGGAIVMEESAPEWLNNIVLKKVYSGKWTICMDLTEGGAGSDVGTLETSAEKNDDGSYNISGLKQFITAGNHNLSDNVCHLVLARIEGAPKGIEGVSVFLVPEKDFDKEGDIIGNNNVTCIKMEKKMGIKGSSTCSENFEESRGWYIGPFSTMLPMMNDERIKVSIQSYGNAEAANQNGKNYANGRIQGTKIYDKLKGLKDAPKVPIGLHSNIHRDLLHNKCQIVGFRALSYHTALHLDRIHKSDDAETIKDSKNYAFAMTPMLKACASNFAVKAALKNIQIHGGMGYITETGVEQFLRDSVIATIYEGTNDIQSIFFNFDRMPRYQKNGYIKKLFGDISEDIQNAKNNPLTQEQAKLVGQAFSDMRNTLRRLGGIAKEGDQGLEKVLVHSNDFMDMFGAVSMGAMWLKIMQAAENKYAREPHKKDFCNQKLYEGDYYIKSVMAPQIAEIKTSIEQGAQPVINSLYKVDILGGPR